MEYSKLIELIKTISSYNISGFQYEEGNTKIVITTGGNPLPGTYGSDSSTMVAGQTQVVSVNNEAHTVVERKDGVEPIVRTEEENAKNVVKSPLVGTFYAAPSEEAEPFVKVGDIVKKGQTLAIVEAMKLMNDIEAEYDGTVLEVLVQNGDAVEYGQALFVIG